MNEIELLSPAGDFECLKAAVQNGADAVYFGANQFNARANSKNFNKEELELAIEYAKLRNVKTHLTINILIQNDEFEDALNLVKDAYLAGIDAVIVQDLGLVKKIIDTFPGLEVHASTQITTYNKEGVEQLEKLGVNRVVLARELDVKEIEEVCKNSNVDIEVFVHGALCICYSGQCLMSSLIGGRSGNRGTCAGSCRLPYALLKNDSVVNKGYLLSSKDVCTLDILPKILASGVKSLKIEGRMKSPYYVGLVTSIYRKYIDLAQSDKPYIVEDSDREKLMQIFNRGGFSTGYLNGKLGKEMMYTKRPNHIGIKVGEVVSYNKNKGYIKVKLEKDLELGDSIAIGDASCKISELMLGNTNIKLLKKGQIATIGRIYGDIKTKDYVFKTVSNSLNKEIEQINIKENKKRKLKGKISIKNNQPISIEIIDELTKINIKEQKDIIPVKAEKTGISEERVKEQLSKTGNTIFEFSNIEVELDDDIIVPISSINELRRDSLEKLKNELKSKIRRNKDIKINTIKENRQERAREKIEVNLCLNKLNKNINYKNLKNINNVYLPIEVFFEKENEQKIEEISNDFNTYVIIPAITKGVFNKLISDKLQKINFKGLVLSNISQLSYLKDLREKDFELIANYTFNAFNNYTIEELKKLGFNKIIISPELNKTNINNLSEVLKKELIVYGRILLMTSEYCTIGTFKGCKGFCKEGKYTLKDRLGLKFPVYTNRINCNNLIYNSKITSIEWKDLNIDSIRIDILEETEEDIKNIIEVHRSNQRLEGIEYTNGNMNKEI